MMQIANADRDGWGIWSHGAKTRGADKSQGSTIRCEVAGIALPKRQPACRILIEMDFFSSTRFIFTISTIGRQYFAMFDHES